MSKALCAVLLVLGVFDQISAKTLEDEGNLFFADDYYDSVAESRVGLAPGTVLVTDLALKGGKVTLQVIAIGAAGTAAGAAASAAAIPLGAILLVNDARKIEDNLKSAGANFEKGSYACGASDTAKVAGVGIGGALLLTGGVIFGCTVAAPFTLGASCGIGVGAAVGAIGGAAVVTGVAASLGIAAMVNGLANSAFCKGAGSYQALATECLSKKGATDESCQAELKEKLIKDADDKDGKLDGKDTVKAAGSSLLRDAAAPRPRPRSGPIMQGAR